MPRKRKPITNQTPLARFIEELIRDRGMTARQIAQECAVSPSVVSSWRNGSTPEALEAVKKLANKYGRSLASVVCGEDDSTISIDKWDRVPLFEGLAEITIKRLVEKKRPT